MQKTIGDRIRHIRESKDLTMEQFGELFTPKASKGVVSNWENNYNKPNKKRLEKIAEIGGISVDELLFGSLEDIIYSIVSDIKAPVTFYRSLKDASNNERELLKKLEEVIISAQTRWGYDNHHYWNNDDSLSNFDKKESFKLKRTKAIRYLVDISVAECEEKKVTVSNRVGILECMVNAIGRYAYKKEYTTEGLITLLHSNLDYILKDAVSYVFLPNSEVERSTVDREISEKAFSIVTKAMNELKELENELT